ncbi:MAG: hypothetical protein GY928_17580 [Colwellia sp.]|nr:hypothetical protein [Colwellia sp.]
MTKLSNPCDRLDIIGRLSMGESSNKIAADFNVSGQRIRQIKKENKELIEQKTQELLKSLPDIVETTRMDIETAKKISIEAKNDINTLTPEKLKFKALTNKISADIYRAIGFFPSQSQGLFVQNIYNDNRTQQVISQNVMAVLGEYIEAEIIE